MQLSSVFRTPSHRTVSPAQFFTLSLGGMVTLLNTSSASIFAGGTLRFHYCHSPRIPLCFLTFPLPLFRPLRVDALVCERREVEREARAAWTAPRRPPDSDRVVRRIHLEPKNVECNCLTLLPLFADRRRSSAVPCPSPSRFAAARKTAPLPPSLSRTPTTHNPSLSSQGEPLDLLLKQ